MIFVSYSFYFFLAAVVILYYALPLRMRWWVLLAGSIFFYCAIDLEGMPVFLITLVASYAAGLLLGKRAQQRREESESSDRPIGQPAGLAFVLALAIVVLPLVISKHGPHIMDVLNIARTGNWIVPLGISFYTLQIVSYLVDVYTGRIEPQRNIFKYALFVSFFPQIVQGPIPRYQELDKQLYEGHAFDENSFVKGFQHIIWGFFLKFMIADRAGIFVDAIFSQYPMYKGAYVFVAGVLYSVQLYTDFLACVVIAQGAASLVGIQLQDNFMRPYHARSIKEFWHRWHMTLSRWLRDYIYIPLGGNRKGKAAKYVNLAATFGVSGLWHGVGVQYLFWGLLHAGYQIGGEVTTPVRERLWKKARMPKESRLRQAIEILVTFLLVMIAWIIFRADSLETGLDMIGSMFTTYNPWVLTNGSLLQFGLDWTDFVLLMVSIGILIVVEYWQAKINVRDRILQQRLPVRWTLYIVAIVAIAVLGSYGFGFDPQDFIYGGF